MAYLSDISSLLGVPLWFLIIILVWSGIWKLIALWKAARNKNIAWFIVLALLNTIGILPILYIFIFSETSKKKSEHKKKTKGKKKK